jgi:hypothetical protein
LTGAKPALERETEEQQQHKRAAWRAGIVHRNFLQLCELHALVALQLSCQRWRERGGHMASA